MTTVKVYLEGHWNLIFLRVRLSGSRSIGPVWLPTIHIQGTGTGTVTGTGTGTGR